MKVAVVTERIETWRGGAETSTMELARLLTGHGHEVHVVTASRCPSPPDLTIHMISASTVLRPLRTTSFIRKATAFLKEHPFDVVHAVVPLACADFYQPRGGLLRETMSRNVAMRQSVTRRMFKRTMAAMNVKQRSLLELEAAAFAPEGPTILAVSDYVARQCEEHYGVLPPRVRVIFNGVQVSVDSPQCQADDRRAIREEYGIDDGTLVLVFVAHNFRLKGLIPLLNAASHLARGGFQDFKLLVVGRDNPVKFRRRIETAGLSDRVIFIGPTQRTGAFFHAADACVHPTYYDPCSRVVLEALARGLPCITTVYNGAAEVIRDGEEGFVLASPDAVDELADRIGRLRSTELRRRMSEKALALGERISMKRHVAELSAVFGETAARRARRTKSA